MSDTKDLGAQNVAYPMSGAPKMHFRRWGGISALTCDPALTPKVVDWDAVTYPPDEPLHPITAPDRICPWCDYARRVYLEKGLQNPPSETWAFETVDSGGHKVWLPFEINGTSSFRPPKGAKVRRITDPEVTVPPLKPPAPVKRCTDGDLTDANRRCSPAAIAAVDRWFVAHAEHVAAAERLRTHLVSRIGTPTDVLVRALDDLQAAQIAEAHAMLETQAAHDELIALIQKHQDDYAKFVADANLPGVRETLGLGMGMLGDYALWGGGGR